MIRVNLNVRQSKLVGVPNRGVTGQRSVVRQLKPEIHPEYYEDCPVYCNGEEVMRVGGTKKEYTVDIWSGNHPFFLGQRSSVVVDEGRVNRFKRRFAGLDSLSNVETASSGQAFKEESGPKLARKVKNKKKK
eukprot:TRINITY_DN116_c0_g1_i1.p1 TRINITY_DN116_c0_g1~~TRINITY_DN116_c0_g1_i1.p1  ORF type:complete len:132 (+),score=20.38 TRINITY_DN116_c0_g1_i1:71-466(+)